MESSFPRFNPVKQCSLQRFVSLSCFSAAVAKENLFKTPAIASLANLKFCCDIQGWHWIGYLWVFSIMEQSECLIYNFLCTELTLFCTELTLFCTEQPENCIYLNQSELSNVSMYIISLKTFSEAKDRQLNSERHNAKKLPLTLSITLVLFIDPSVLLATHV